MRAISTGLLVEEQRTEIAAAWKRGVEHELGGEPALAFAVGPLLREMALALRGEDRLPRSARAAAVNGGLDGHARGDPDGAPLRSAVLVRSGAAPARIAREFKILHRAVWEALRAAGHVVGADERRAADEWLDEALAAMLDRADRLRTRADLLDRPAERPSPASGMRPPPLPRTRPVLARPPPFPAVGVE